MSDNTDVGFHLTDDGDHDEDALGRIESALRGLRFGTVTAVVLNGVVVQVERTEKVRLQRTDRH